MKKIEYKVLPKITEELLQCRFDCFNESLGYYKSAGSALEVYDDFSFHIQFTIDNKIAGYTRLTPCPYNYMELNKPDGLSLPNDSFTLEMGRTIVMPEFRGMRLLNLILLVGLEICENLGYKLVIGNESYEAHLKMPKSIGFKFMNIIEDFKMPGSEKGYHTFYLISCDLIRTNKFRELKLNEFKKYFNDNGFLI